LLRRLRRLRRRRSPSSLQPRRRRSAMRSCACPSGEAPRRS
jgi:hypothetical protein